jgi:hypothetical protein
LHYYSAHQAPDNGRAWLYRTGRGPEARFADRAISYGVSGGGPTWALLDRIQKMVVSISKAICRPMPLLVAGTEGGMERDDHSHGFVVEQLCACLMPGAKTLATTITEHYYLVNVDRFCPMRMTLNAARSRKLEVTSRGGRGIHSAYKQELRSLFAIPWAQRQARRFASCPVSLLLDFYLLGDLAKLLPRPRILSRSLHSVQFTIIVTGEFRESRMIC